MFDSEKDLVDCALPMLQEFFPSENEFTLIQEPKGLFGIPDVLVYNGSVISIEFKLNKWKRALEQAYRYRSFSSQAYVFLDNDFVDIAVKNLEQFEKYNIGLCGVENSKIIPYSIPASKHPYSDNMRCKAFDIINTFA